jgi:prolycopene isomerase
MDKRYDVLVIGGGLGGLTAAALLAKRGLSVLVLERNCQPGGSCGAFRRRGHTLDLGAAMLFGFGEKGFNPHRFVMNELEEEIEVYRHESMYRLHYKENAVVFWPERDRFLAELGSLFPGAERELEAFYRDLEKLYETVMSANSVFLSPSETPKADLAAGLFKHPINQARLLGLLGKSAMSLMRRHVKDEALFKFFNKLTSTYSYTTIEETPALLAVTMFVENHVGGSYSIAGSPMALVARLEKALEKFGGEIRYGSTAASIIVDRESDGAGARAIGAVLESGEEVIAEEVLYGGTVWNLYERLLPREIVPQPLSSKIQALKPTFPSSVLYGALREDTLPKDAFPVEMLIGNPDSIDESDVTLYLSSLEDPSLAPKGSQVFMLIGPSSRSWPSSESPEYQGEAYREAKEEEAERMLDLVERRFPGFRSGILFRELGSPSTIERYLLKNGGAVAGPKQCMGQELMKRQTAETFLAGLTMCGESTVMGTGTPAVTISGISAADLILRRRGLKEYRNRASAKQYVKIIPKGQAGNRQLDPAFAAASLCQWCEGSPCSKVCPKGIDIMGIMRRLEAGNILGAARKLREASSRREAPSAGRAPCSGCAGKPCLAACSRLDFDDKSVPIAELLIALGDKA